MTTSIHDAHIREILVQVHDRIIRLRTAFPDPAGPEFAEVVFEGVEAYVFNGDALGTILFDVEQVDATALYLEYAKQMQHAYSHAGGHASWTESESAARAHLAAARIQGYRVSSSIGLEGGVWARKLTIKPAS